MKYNKSVESVFEIAAETRPQPIRLYRMKSQPPNKVDAWLETLRRLWNAHVDALERHLDQMDASTPKKEKPRRN